MSRSARLSPLAVTFFVWFALWFVGGRYISVSFYRFQVGEAVEVALGLMTLLVALALLIVRFLHPDMERRARWSYPVLCIGLLAVVELAWRLVISQLHWEVGKVLGMIMDISTPALLALGAVTVLAERRLSRRQAETGISL